MAERPRRSLLYMPGSNQRALDKARGLPADGLILDLEDAVAPQAKELARSAVAEALEQGGYGRRELLVRVNALDSPWGAQDLAALARMPADGVVLPKVSRPEDLAAARAVLDGAGARADLPLWVMVETALGVLNLAAIAAVGPPLAGLVMGTSDLAKALRVGASADRAGMLTALSQCVLAGRAHGLAVIDGVHLDLDDAEALQRQCEQGRDLGFDGKSLIHPRQLETANRVFAPSASELARAEAIVAAWQGARQAGAGVCVVDGRLVEQLHVEEARRLLALHQMIEAG